MSDTNRTTLAYVKEVTYGTTPSGPPTLQNFNFTSESLQQNTTVAKSNIIRSDRQIVDFPRTGIQAAGDLGYELQFGGPDDFWQAGLCSANWTSPVTIAAGPSYTISVPGGVNTITRATGSFITDGLVVGQWIKITLFANAVNNQVFKILTLSATVITLAGPTMTVETSVTTAVIKQLGMIQNGTTLTSWAMEMAFLDLSSEFSIMNGMCVDKFTLTGGPNTIMTGSFSFMGKKELSAAATAGTGSNTAAPTTSVMQTVDNYLYLLEAGLVLPIIKSGLTVANNLRARLQVGTLGPASIGMGTFDASGTLQAYYGGQTSTGKALIDKYLNYTTSSIAQIQRDGAGNVYVQDLGSVKFSKGARDSTGLNQDVIADLAYNATYESATAQTLRMFRG